MGRIAEALTLGVSFVLLILATMYAIRHVSASPGDHAMNMTPPVTVVARSPEAVEPPGSISPVAPATAETTRTAASAASSAGAFPAPITTPVPTTTDSPTAAQATPAPDYLARGRHLTRLFYTGQLSAVWSAFLPSLRAEWKGKLSAFQAYREGGLKTYGAETGLLKERLIRDKALTYYTRTATFERGPQTGWTLILGLDARGKVQEFGIISAGLLPD